MKRTLLVLSTIIGSMSFAQDCSDLFISEYVEGWSNNKALEIYNPTSNVIDLSQYYIARFSNGSSSATAGNAVQLVGTINPGDVHVAVLDKRDPQGTGQEAPVWDSLQARADAFYCPVYNTSNAFYFNGNDAIVLGRGSYTSPQSGVLVDIFGKIGEDPGIGWTTEFPYVSAGDTVTKDYSLIRKSTIRKGVTNPVISFFNPLLEYDSIPATVILPAPPPNTGDWTYGNWFSLGEHTCDCFTAGVEEVASENVSVFPNPTNGKFYVKGTGNYSTITVVNSLGQEVERIENNSKTVLAIDLGNSKGVYFVKLIGENKEAITKRVIIK